ncbi:MAG: ADP-ribosylglycohydrolase family protein [Candidatus Eremiobacteraeota bacterium]|nr:ADP-ribosylglycohydrolase family protein [Candidatus Eremiobacteraeota bacterium]
MARQGRKATSRLLLDRARGALVGLAVGDALGFALEGLKPAAIRRRYGEHHGRYRFLGRTGYVSDDTEQAVMVARSLLTRGQEAEDFGRRLFRWFLTAPPGIGRATLRACLLRAVGVKRGTASAGNGAAMRMAPVGLVDWQAELVRQNALVTHTDPRAVDGALVVALAVHRLVRQEAADWPSLSNLLPELDPRLQAAMQQSWQAAGDDTAAAELGTSGYVLHSVPVAFWALWRQPPDFLSGLQPLLRQGGDTDSNAAIAGALLGASFGFSSIPTELVDRLEPSYSGQLLCGLADALVEGREPPPEPSFLSQRWREAKIKLGVAGHVLGRIATARPWE